MDEELLELQRQFESAQQAKSSIRLSERNVVELVLKLQELQIIDFELLHTTSGKEYITPVINLNDHLYFESQSLISFFSKFNVYLISMRGFFWLRQSPGAIEE